MRMDSDVDLGAKKEEIKDFGSLNIGAKEPKELQEAL